jgi:nucleotide-binding universal stress UspA family protein
VLAGVRAGHPQPVMPEILAEHGVEAVLHVLPIGAAVFGEALLAKVHEIGADLLVMGAYTHTAWRELILGGVTKYMLAHADLPVLMRH